MHLNSYLQTRFLAIPSRSRRLIFTHISKFSILALVILHSVHEMTASSLFLCVQLGSQIRHFHSLNLRLLAFFPHYMLSEVLFQTKMTVLRNSAIHVSTKTVPYFHTTFHYFFSVDRRLGYHSHGRGGSKGPWK